MAPLLRTLQSATSVKNPNFVKQLPEPRSPSSR